MSHLAIRACVVLLALFSAVFAPLAHSHTGSTAYVQWDADRATLRWDFPLRDLALEMALDDNADGQLQWGEVQAAAPRIATWAAGHLRPQSAAQACTFGPMAPLQVVEHGGELSVVMRWSLPDCRAAPFALAYSARFAEDFSHRALLRVQHGGTEHSAVLSPELTEWQSGKADGSAWATFQGYAAEGVAHVVSGYDHVLFLAGLFLPIALVWRGKAWQALPKLGPVLKHAAALVTGFTIAHAATLCLAAIGVLQLPSRAVESAVAATVLFAGANNLYPMVRTQLMALCVLFGLIHGTAIAGALLDLGLPTSGRVWALLGFNLGVEFAQLSLVAVLVPIVFALRHWRPYVRWVMQPLSVFIAVSGALWLVNRAFDLGWQLP